MMGRGYDCTTVWWSNCYFDRLGIVLLYYTEDCRISNLRYNFQGFRNIYINTCKSRDLRNQYLWNIRSAQGILASVSFVNYDKKMQTKVVLGPMCNLWSVLFGTGWIPVMRILQFSTGNDVLLFTSLTHMCCVKRHIFNNISLYFRTILP